MPLQCFHQTSEDIIDVVGIFNFEFVLTFNFELAYIINLGIIFTVQIFIGN